MTSSAAVDTKPLRRDAARNRTRILHAAGEVFAERGLDVTLHDIARHAGLGVGTVYRRFANRDELIDALFVESFEVLARYAHECLELEDPWQAFVAYVEKLVAMMADDRGLWTVMTTAASKGRNFVLARERLSEVTTELIIRAQAAGELRADFRHDDLPVLHVILGSGADFLADAAPDAWRRYLGIVLDGLRSHRHGATPLPVDVPSSAALEQAMETWRPGKR
jgi:AcrR family transcriptional regulator